MNFKSIFLCALSFFSVLAFADSSLSIDLTIRAWSEGEETDKAALLADGWKQTDPDEDSEWQRTIQLKQSDLRTPKNYCVNSGCFTVNAKGLLSLEFESGDNAVRTSVNLQKNRSGKFTPQADAIILSASGHDNSSWGFGATAKVNVSE